VSACKERVEQPLEDHQLPACVDELVVHDLLVRARSFKQDRMRADLAQQHHGVLQVHVVDLFHCNAEQRIGDCRRTRVRVKRRTLGLELMLRSYFGDRLGGEAGLARARARAHPTQLLTLFDLARDPPDTITM
jgi:hypothetical protein